MHIPDGFLDAKTALATGILATAGLTLALREARRTLPPAKVPLLGLSAAFVFAAQMLNFPVAGGTSGHLIGGVLTAALLGPAAAIIVLSCVLIVQCFMFADGGITTLGANIFNMGIIGGAVGWMILTLLSRLIPGLFGRIVAAVVASWAATVLAAIACAGELAASATIPWKLAFPAMAGTHMLIGIGEGLITAAVLAQIAMVRPELVISTPTPEPATYSYRPIIAYGLIAALGLALFVSPFACSWPDGLDAVAEHLGFKNKESELRPLPSPLADYKIPGLTSPAIATALAGATGTLLVFGLGLMTARTLLPRKKPTTPLSPQN